MYLVHRHPAGISRLRLTQLVRLADALRKRENEEPIVLDYEDSIFGPYSQTIIGAVQSLESCGALVAEDNCECEVGRCVLASALSDDVAKELDAIVVASAGATTARLCGISDVSGEDLVFGGFAGYHRH